ncbi:MAG: M24 family metallopeptidase [Acidobacteriota bacterium]
MNLNRRTLLRLSAGAAAAAAFGCSGGEGQRSAQEGGQDQSDSRFSEAPPSIRTLQTMTGGVVPISGEERRQRMEKARRLMSENGMAALYLEPGSSLFYYTGVRWGRSERMFAMVLPASGEPAYVCPKFEEQRAREVIHFGDDVRTWEEDESPAQRVAQIFKDRGIRSGKVGMEERVRFFLFDGIRRAAPHLQYVSATPVTAGCRMYKSAAELALMQRANDITIEAYKVLVPLLHPGMTKTEFSQLSSMAHRALGVSGRIGVNFGEASAFPHGSIQPRSLREGDIVLMDGGCSLEGYRSDISRTTVFGKPTQRQTDVWNLELEAQNAAFKAAQVGVPCEDVDAAARKVIVEAGFGPGYKVPGLPHRTGHGIGLDGHEWTNFVRGNKTPLAPGMCFSDEPTIAIYGEFGIRLEDDLYMTEEGPRFFTRQSVSITQPFG